MISFLHPWVLAALPLAALPIILHLLARREPPTIAFPSVRYLRTATEEHQRRLKLQHWLLLLLRTLLILARDAEGPPAVRRVCAVTGVAERLRFVPACGAPAAG